MQVLLTHGCVLICASGCPQILCMGMGSKRVWASTICPATVQVHLVVSNATDRNLINQKPLPCSLGTECFAPLLAYHAVAYHAVACVTCAIKFIGAVGGAKGDMACSDTWTLAACWRLSSMQTGNLLALQKCLLCTGRHGSVPRRHMRSFRVTNNGLSQWPIPGLHDQASM